MQADLRLVLANLVGLPSRRGVGVAELADGVGFQVGQGEGAGSVQVLADERAQAGRVFVADRAHVNPYVWFLLDMNIRLDLTRTAD